jgi:hypothetical protein
MTLPLAIALIAGTGIGVFIGVVVGLGLVDLRRV